MVALLRSVPVLGLADGGRLDEAVAMLPDAEAMALNSYVRAEFARLLVMRTRLNATRSKPLTAEQIAAASAYAQERQMMNFEQEDL